MAKEITPESSPRDSDMKIIDRIEDRHKPIPKTKKCVQCGSQHYYKSKESNYEKVGDTCQSCTFIIDCLKGFVTATNGHSPVQVGRPNRKLTITGFTIEKI